MKTWILLCTLLAITTLAIGCEKTIREPGEPEHGGMFLHSDSGHSTSQP